MSQEWFYTYAEAYNGKILVRGVKNGKRFTAKQSFSPSLWVPSKSDTEFKSLDNIRLQQVKFDTFSEYRKYIRDYSDVDNFRLFGDIGIHYQYLYEKFPGKIEYDFAKVKIYVLDAETTVDFGFPDYRNPLESITVLTVCDLNENKYTTFGVGKYKNDDPEVTYIECADEKELFLKFLSFWTSDYPDAVTGWNIEDFDVPYLYARMQRILGENSVSALSPFDRVEADTREFNGNQYTKISIYGISVLDYLLIYKKFGFKTQENYRLDTVAEDELGENKLENPYDTFKEFYENDWQKFVEYNIHDTRLVMNLEHKRNLLRLVLTISYIAKINYNNVFSPVRTWDTLIYNYLRDRNIIIPSRRVDDTDNTIEGAYVKEPIPNMYNWVVSFDLNSLYPHLIMSMNMSPETIDDFMVDTNVERLLGGDVSQVKEGYSLAANGSQYNMSKTGFIPELMNNLYTGRKVEKNIMLETESKLEAIKSKATKREIAELNSIISTKDSLQNALKTLMNSGYGAMANVGFRFFDQRIAEGITMSGQLVIQTAERNANALMDKIVGSSKDRVIASDTDSLYVHVEDLVNKFAKDKSKDQQVTFVERASAEKIAPTLNSSLNQLAYSLNWNQDLLVFKLEKVADRGIWSAKKRYALHVYSSEGVRYKAPKVAVKGLEIVRSTVPGWVRDKLKKAVEIVMTQTQDDLHEFVSTVESEYKTLPIIKIATNSSANNLVKYSHATNIYAEERVPIAVRAVLLYNHYLEEYNLGLKYQKINEGTKIKFVYLKEPNHIHENVIGFLTKLPVEFGLDDLVDYGTMFDKSFINPLTKLISSFGWSPKPKATLEGLFG